MSDYKIIISSEQIFIVTSNVSLQSSSSGTIIKQQSKALNMFKDKKVIGDTLKTIYEY